MNEVFFNKNSRWQYQPRLRLILNYIILNYDCSWKYKCNVSQGILVLGGQRTSIATTQTEYRVKTLSIIFYMFFPLQIFLNQMP